MTAPVTTAQEPSGERDDVLAPLAARLGIAPRTLEWVLGGLLAVAAIALTVYIARDLWFTSDEWEYLTHRRAFDLEDLTRPVGGHWTTWSTFLLRGLYAAVGVDFWPWFYIPRLIGHTLLMTFIWRVMCHRGTDPLLGLVAYAVLLVLGASGYQRALQVGNWAVYAALIVCALIIARRPDDPSVADRVVVGGALLVAVLGNGYALAVIGGITIALLLTRRIVAWIPSLIPAIAAYGAWWLYWRDDIRPKPEVTLDKILDIPSGAFRVTRSAIEATTGLPGWLAAVAVVALVVWIVVLAVRRRFDQFDSIILCTLAVGLALLTVQRLAFNEEAASRLRYGYSVSVLLALALVPHIRAPRAAVGRVVLVLVGLGLVVVNVDQMRIAINVREDASQEARVLSVAAAEMIAAGEPVVAGPSTIAPGLETDELVQLVDEGYGPDPLPDYQADRAAIEAEARGALRMNLINARRPRNGYDAPAGTPPTTSADVDPDGCVELSLDEPVTAQVQDAGLLTFTKGRPQVLGLTWEDEYGVGTRRLDDPDVREAAVELADPTDTAELTLVSRIGALTVCGFRGA